MTENKKKLWQQHNLRQVFAKFNGLIKSLVQSKGLDPKTKQLIYIGMKACQGDETAVFYHAPMAKQA